MGQLGAPSASSRDALPRELDQRGQLRGKVWGDGGLVPAALATERQGGRNQMLADGGTIRRGSPLPWLAQQRPYAEDQLPAPGRDLPLCRRELGSQEVRELGLGSMEGEERLGA